MYETSYNGISYCFYDDRLTLNGNVIRYELMDNIQHRGGDSPAFIFDYSGRKFAMPYPPAELPHILPYMKAASEFRPEPDPVELVSLDSLSVEQPIVAEPVYSDRPLSGPAPERSVSQPLPASQPAPPKKSVKKGCLVLAVIFVALFVALGACLAGGDDVSDDSTVADEPAVAEDITEAPTTAADPLADLSAEERNAYGSATAYLASQGFSRSGLIDQLKYEQYSEDACEKAVSLIEENGEVDWNEECLESAKNYLDTMSFSKQELIDQLKHEGFTDDQINAIIDEAYQ